jgi:putative transposase
VNVDIKRAYKFRVYPTKEQEIIFLKTFGCVRYVYNHMLAVRTDAWKESKKSVGYLQSSALLTKLKENAEFSWLNDVSATPLQQSLRHLQTALANFFAGRAKYPAFKKKGGKQSASYTSGGMSWDGQRLKLGRMKEPLNIRWSRELPKAGKLLSATVTKDAAGRYFVSLLFNDAISSLPSSIGMVGIDLGLLDFATLSNGMKFKAPNIFRSKEARLAVLNRRVHKKQLNSKNRLKARLKAAKLHAEIADSRKDFLHKLSTKLVRENQTIAVETLAVKNMLKNRRLSKSIGDAGWHEFVRQLEYKSRWYGRDLLSLDRWYPSSKTCSCCGSSIAKLPLNIRSWDCSDCGASHDRDVNAARNILTAGLAGLALGEKVSPVCT